MVVKNILNKKQLKLYRLCGFIVKKCSENPGIVQKVFIFAQRATEMQETLNDIDEAQSAKHQSRNTTHATQQKNTAKNNLVTALDDVTNVILLVAAREKNENWRPIAETVLKQNIKDIPFETLVVTVQNYIIFLASIDPKIIVKYGITQEIIDNITVNAKIFKELVSKKDDAVEQKGIDTAILAKLFDRLETAKKELDILIPMFKRIDFDFFDAYMKLIAKPPKTSPPKDTSATDTPTAEAKNTEETPPSTEKTDTPAVENKLLENIKTRKKKPKK